MARESKPGKKEIKNEIKTRCKRDPALAGASSRPENPIGRLKHMKDPVAVQQQAGRSLAIKQHSSNGAL